MQECACCQQQPNSYCCMRPAANSYCLPAASSQPGCRQPASQRRRAQPAATASLRMPPHGGSPASCSSHRLVAGLPSGIATMQMDNLRQKPGAIVIPATTLTFIRLRREIGNCGHLFSLGWFFDDCGSTVVKSFETHFTQAQRDILAHFNVSTGKMV
jgi:hypothetical protein